MSIKDIITVPDETLKKKSDPIEKVGLNEKKLISQASLASMTLPENNDPTKPKMKGFKVACTVESI